MDYLFMHKNDILCHFSATKEYVKVNEVIDEFHLPYFFKEKALIGENFVDWLYKRSIPESRPRRDELIKACGGETLFDLIIRNKGLSLTDQYWIKPEDSAETWEEVNFFSNGYEELTGDILIKNEGDFCLSPDISTNGVLPKAWRRREGIDYLFKFGKKPFYQEPFNEIASSKIAAKFPLLNAVQYKLGVYEGKYASVCKNFITEDTEFVPAAQIYKKENDKFGNIRVALISELKDMGITGASRWLDQMLLFDYMICNTDRHLGNFGVLRNSDTGMILGMAPLFDSGSSLWADEPGNTIIKEGDIAKGIADSQANILENISNFRNLPLEIFDMAFEIGNYIYKYTKECSDKKRAQILKDRYDERLLKLKEIVLKKERLKEYRYKEEEELLED